LPKKVIDEIVVKYPSAVHHHALAQAGWWIRQEGILGG